MTVPAWLSDNDASADPSPPGGTYEMSQGVSATTPGVQEVGASSATVEAGGSTQSAADDAADLPRIILFMRLANMAAAILILVASILKMVNIPVPSAFVLAIYASCGGILICCLETQLKFLRVMIAVNFGFLFNSFWRFLFYLLLASVHWTYETLLGMITGGVLVGVAVFNTYVLCRYPSYRKIREKIAEEEDKRIEARISSEVKRQAARQITGGN